MTNLEQHAMRLVLGEYLSEYAGLPDGDLEQFLRRGSTVVHELFEELNLRTMAHFIQASYSAALEALKHAAQCAYGPSTRRLALAGAIYNGDCAYIEDVSRELVGRLEVWWYADVNDRESSAAVLRGAKELMQMYGFVQTNSAHTICSELFRS